MAQIDESRSDPLLAFLASLAGQHIHFFPKSGNAGDGLITHATYELFERFNIAYTTYHQSETAPSEPVVIGGGGNLIEGRYTDVADLIRRHSPRKIVLLPHTVVGYADIVAKTHDNLTLFLRDSVSHALALANGASEANTFLSHDLAFFLEDEHFAKFQRRGKGVLHALRQDGESAGALPIGRNNLDLSLSWNGDLWTDRGSCRASTESLASYIAQYDSVLTDRLHISILSSMLGKRVALLPNAYFKNRAIYEHSMRSRFPRTQFINVLPTAPGSLNGELELREQLSNSQALERETARRESAERTLQLCRDQLDEATDALAQLEDRVTELIDEKRRAHDERVEAVGQLEIALDRSAQALRTLEASVVTQSDVWGDERAAMQQKIAQLSAQASAAEATIAQLSAQASAAEATIAELYRSTSWRVTAPLRKIKTVIRG